MGGSRLAFAQALFPSECLDHHPDAVGFAVKLFDLFQEAFQGGLVTVLPGNTS